MTKFGLAILFTAIAAVGFSQTDSVQTTFSVVEAQAYALENSNKAKQAASQVLITIKKKKEVRAIGLPQINGEVKFQNFLDIPTTLVPASAFNPLAPDDEFAELQFGTDYNTSAGITASQLLFDGSYLVGLKIAEDYTNLYVNQEKKTKLEILEDVTNTYYSALVGFEELELDRKNLIKAKNILIELEIMKSEGMVEELSVDQQKLVVSEIERRVSASETNVEITLQFLKIKMGMEINEDIRLTSDLNEVLNSLSYDDLANQKFTIEQNVDHQIIETMENINKLSLRNEQLANLPSISAFFSHTQNNMGNELDFSTWYPTTLWGITARVPIFGSGSRMYKTQIAKIELERTQNDKKAFDELVTLESRTSKAQLKMAYEAYNISKKNMDLAERILNTGEIKLKEGVISSSEFSQMQQQYISQQEIYISSMYQVLTAKSKLDKAYNNY